ncbi:hypothetical protein SGFS_075490 [Streptomyces graminofaciens]|uniref:Uncharacterized protein n=1 Tax=Streptomyces graminofaciens TaxID=68212 RepID=A0ABN5VSV8_9ACTN|nr:hypothetical protein SGFS_075490 [Streptomyces graminofaciens]
MTVLPEVSALAAESDDASLPVFAPQALRAAAAPAAEIPANRPRLLMLSPDIQNLHAPKGRCEESGKTLGRESTEHASETAALARGSPSRIGVPSGLVAEVRPQPAAELFPLRFGVI